MSVSSCTGGVLDKLNKAPNNDWEQNLLSNEINSVISCYLSDLFNRLETECFDDNIDKLISDILLLSEDTRLQILKKVFCLVDEFYKYILEREKLDVNSYHMIYIWVFLKNYYLNI